MRYASDKYAYALRLLMNAGVSYEEAVEVARDLFGDNDRSHSRNLTTGN